MATIQENLQKIINSKAAIKNSINAKGGTITDSTPLDEYSTAIDNLSIGGKYVKEGEDSIIESYTGESSGWTTDVMSSVACLLEEIVIPFSTMISNSGANQNYGGLFNSGSSINRTLKKVTVPNGSYVYDYRLAINCITLEEIVGTVSPTTILDYCFYRCISLRSAIFNFNDCTSIRQRAFSGMGYLRFKEGHMGELGDIVVPSTVNMSNASSAFEMSNFNSIEINQQSLTGSRKYAILGSRAIVGDICTSINGSVFSGGGYFDYDFDTHTFKEVKDNFYIKILVLKPNVPPTLTDYAEFSNLQHIYVPSASVEAYRTATNWSNFASIIEANPDE